MSSGRSPALAATIAAVVGLFLGGAVVGDGMARAFAPGSWIAEVAGFFALPLAFAASLHTWYGLALLGLIRRFLAVLRGRKTEGVGAGPTGAASLPGSFVFLPFSSVAGAAAGLLVGLASPTHSVWVVAMLFWTVGSAHGALAWALARRGVLMPPESI